MTTASKLLGDKHYSRVALTNRNGFVVSTVWLGLDHGFGHTPPLIFETMVFDPQGNELECERYASEQEAHEGHMKMVKKLANIAKKHTK